MSGLASTPTSTRPGAPSAPGTKALLPGFASKPTPSTHLRTLARCALSQTFSC